MPTREQPLWLKVLLNISGPLGVGLALLGYVNAGLGLIFLVATALYVGWEIYPSAIALRQRRKIVSLVAFVSVGAFMGLCAWALILRAGKGGGSAVAQDGKGVVQPQTVLPAMDSSNSQPATTRPSSPQPLPLEQKDKIEIVSFNSSQDITISNDGPNSVYVIRLEASEEKGSSSFGLDFEIKPGTTETRHIGAGFQAVRTIETLGDTWQEHYARAMAKYPNCWQFNFFSSSDPAFQQVKEHYSVQGSRLVYDEVQGILYYKREGIPGIRQQTVPLVVIVTVNKDTCP